ncbi:PD-(D/E)XK nuclease family protein [Alicyclobacillus shizuokensis]|uniref:PD-(D/E)XK nuclease family protein n=1 Tax=Alicyclobacillus shizuokensis TaxID=392014 RepID=UPI00082A22B0|nr:PD-(D/E)XK nuclease family protein [Alicyclobacillus shizuokensis]
MPVLQPMIDRFLQQKQQQNDRPMRNKLHPSTIGMCQRKIVFEMMVVPRALDPPRLARVFDNGHKVHERYEQLFMDMGIGVAREVKLEKGDISGHTDALIKLYSFAAPQGEYWLVELKSASSKSFEWMVKNNQPKKEHKAQLTFYMHLSGIHKGVILVENKDNQEIWEYEMEYDPVFGQQLEQKALWLIDLAKHRILPPIPRGFSPSHYKCAYCPFAMYCHYGSRTEDGQERYPIPFMPGTEAYRDILKIIEAMEQGKSIPNVIEGDTIGELIQEMTRKSQTYVDA